MSDTLSKPCTMYLDGKSIASVSKLELVVPEPPTPNNIRCICGARPTPAGDLPCGH